MNYNNNDDNRIRRKKVSSNDYNYKSKQHQRYYKEKVRLDNTSYERKIENNKIKRDNTNRALIFFFISYSITMREEDGKNEKPGYNVDYGKCILPY